MWNWSFAWKVLPQILKAMEVTLEATAAGFVVAAIVGLLFSVGRRSRFKIIRWPITGIIEFIRSTPLLVQLFFIYAVLPFWGLTWPPFICGMVGLGLHYSTYLSEVYRSGIEGVPRGQWEASKALNLTPIQTWTRVIIPQAIPPIIPVMGNYLIMMYKETPLLIAVSVIEMLNKAEQIGSMTFNYIEPITIVGLLFLVISYPSSLLVLHFERKLNRSLRN